MMEIKSDSVKYLPLSLSGVLLGMMLAAADYHVNPGTMAGVAVAAVMLHFYIANESRLSLILSIAGCMAAVWFSFGTLLKLESLVLLLFGYFVIRLVLGARSGKGRIMDGVVTFITAGPIAVIGTFFLCSHSFGSWILLLPAVSTGMMSVSAYGLRDRYPAVIHVLLVLSGAAAMIAYACLRLFDPWHFIFAAVLPVHIYYLFRLCSDKKGDPEIYVPIISVSTLIFALLAGAGFLAFLIF